MSSIIAPLPSSFRVGAKYLTANNKIVTILEVDEANGLLTVLDEFKQYATYDMNGDPPQRAAPNDLATQLGRLMKLLSGYEKGSKRSESA